MEALTKNLNYNYLINSQILLKGFGLWSLPSKNTFWFLFYLQRTYFVRYADLCTISRCSGCEEEGSMVVCTEIDRARSACLLAVMPSGFDLAGLDLTHTVFTDLKT